MRPSATPDDLIPVNAFLRGAASKSAPKDKLLRLVTERVFQPRTNVGPFTLPAKIDWEAQDRKVDRNWRMQLQGWMMFSPIMHVFDAGDAKPEAVAYFLETVADWWQHYGQDADDIVTSRMPDSFVWYDMSVGFRALVLSFFLNRIRHFDLPLTDEQRQLLDDVTQKHIRHLTHRDVFSLNNHGIFQMHGLHALTKTTADPDRFRGERDYAIARMTELVAAQFDDRGVHREHSPHYHFYAIQMFLGTLQSGWYDGIAEFTDRLNGALEAQKWLIDPLKRVICVGDSVLAPRTDVDFPDDDSIDWVISDFDSSGYAVLRSCWGEPAAEASMVFLMGAYHTTTHKHRDCLSFEWFDKGRRVLVDGGKYGYSSDAYRAYALSYAAHNNIQFAGFDILKMPPYGSAIEGVERLPGNIFRMTAALRMKAITHVRHLHVNPGHWIVVEDVIEQARGRVIKQHWHLDSDYQMQRLDGGVLRAVTGDGQTVTIEPMGWRPDVAIHRGDSNPVQGHSFIQDLTPQPALALSYSGEFHSGTVLTVISLSDKDREAAHDYCRTQFGMPMPEVEALPNLKAILPGIPHKVVAPGQPLVLDPGEKTYTMLAGGLALSFFAAIQPSQPRRLLVMLPGASTRKRGHIDFQRFTWAKDYPAYDVVSISDPSLKADNDIGLAWFQNNAERFGIDALADGIAQICAAGGYAQKDMVLFGSSGGGFAGLKLAPRFPKARVIAINPQIYLPKYSRGPYQKMLATCYPNLSEATVLERFASRFRVFPDLVNRPAPVFLFQNSHDPLHVQHHLAPLLAQIAPEMQAEFSDHVGPETDWRALNVIRYSDAVLGHSPPSRPDTNKMIAPLLAPPVDTGQA